MAQKKVTGGEKPKRKIVISTVEMKKELITKWKVVHLKCFILGKFWGSGMD
jgi:hypothetical protein